jgi:hypothetical protein
MFRTLVQTEHIDVEGHSCVAHFFVRTTTRGAQRYSCELLLKDGERIILDDDSLASLSTKVARLAPAMVYSRAIALGSKPEAAA